MASEQTQGTRQQHISFAGAFLESETTLSIQQRRQRSWPARDSERKGSHHEHKSPLTEANIKERKSFDFVRWTLEKRKPPVNAKLAIDSLSATQSKHSNGGTQTRRNDGDDIEDLDRWMAVCDKIAEAGSERIKTHLAK